jgi:excinuclease ABC subunit A
MGGLVLAAGTPESIAADPDSHTGRFLAEVLGRPAAAEQVDLELVPQG